MSLDMDPIVLLSLFSLHALSLSVMCRLKYSPKVTAFIWGVVCVFCVGLSLLCQALFSDIWISFAYSVTILLFYFCCAFLVDESPSQTIFLFLLYAFAFMAICILSECLVCLFHVQAHNLAAILIRRGLQVVILLCYIKWIKRKFDASRSKLEGGWWCLNLTAAMIQAFEAILFMKIMAEKLEIYQWFLVLMLLLLFVMVYWVIFRTIGLMRTAAEKEESEQREHFLRRQMEMMKERDTEARRIRHDARHHNLLLADYAENGQLLKIRDYLKQQEMEYRQSSAFVFCENSAVNSILSAYCRKAENVGISMEIHAEAAQDIGVREIDLTAILGNLLENAVNGCLLSQCVKNEIHVRIRTKSKKFVIVVENSCDETLVFHMDGNTKEKKIGIGIQSILHSARIYNGETDFQAKDGLFRACVLLNLKKAKNP